MKDGKTKTYRARFIKVEKDVQEHINEDGHKHR
jgi:phage anti-repressor protein